MGFFKNVWKGFKKVANIATSAVSGITLFNTEPPQTSPLAEPATSALAVPALGNLGEVVTNVGAILQDYKENGVKTSIDKDTLLLIFGGLSAVVLLWGIIKKFSK